MIRRMLLTAAVLMVPLGALADDASSLGPQTDSGSGSSGGTSSTGALNILQPASPSSVQSADSAGSGAAQSANNAASLQTTGTADAAKLLIQGEADTQKDPESGVNLTWLWYLLVTLGTATAITATLVFIQNRSARLSSE